MKKPKTTNALMSYLRNTKGIEISGSLQKRKLRYMGYYHGYKGYRYYSSPQNLLPFNNFNELQAVYDFDLKLKALMYEKIMFLETTIKNYALEAIVEDCQSSKFADIFSNAMTAYKAHSVGSGRYKSCMEQRLRTRNKIYDLISRDYQKPLVSHYYNEDRLLPIWAIFELFSLGEFGNFMQCLNSPLKSKISESLGIKRSYAGDGKIICDIVFTLKDLRNAVAHNGVVFDTRFKTSTVSNSLTKFLESETTISNIDFDTITDYIVLVSTCLRLLKCNKSEILNFIKQFEDICDTLRNLVPFNLFSKILSTESRNEINQLKMSIKTS